MKQTEASSIPCSSMQKIADAYKTIHRHNACHVVGKTGIFWCGPSQLRFAFGFTSHFTLTAVKTSAGTCTAI